MSVKLLTEHHLEFLRLKGGCIGLSDSTLVKLLEISCHRSFRFVQYDGPNISLIKYEIIITIF